MKNTTNHWGIRSNERAGPGQPAQGPHGRSGVHDSTAANRAGEPIHSVFSQQMHGLRARMRARPIPREASIPATPPPQGEPPAVPGSPIEPEMPDNPDLPSDPAPPEVVDPPPDVVTIPVRDPPVMPTPID